MNHQTIGDVSARIGALELGVFNAVGDGDLETTVQAGPNAAVTLIRNSRRGCEFIDVNDDSALEAAVLSMGPPPPTQGLNCLTQMNCRPRIDDSELEASATVAAGPTRLGLPGCAPFAAPTYNGMPGCYHIDDSALEGAVFAASGPNGGPAYSRGSPYCPRIDDSVLEATVLSMWNPTLDPRCRTHRCY